MGRLGSRAGGAARLGAQVITCRPQHPARLRDLRSSLLLYVRGELIEPDEFAIAIVSRRATEYGRRMVAEIAGQLASVGERLAAASMPSAPRRVGAGAAPRPRLRRDQCYPAEHRRLRDLVAGRVPSSEYPWAPRPTRALPGAQPRYRRFRWAPC